MKEHDELDALLREWKPPAPAEELDRRVAARYRAAVRRPLWREFWKLRISVPAPVLLAAVAAIVALVFWLRPTAARSMPAATPGTGSSLTAGGFQPLPNGEARVVPVSEVQR
ncbi:MAG TPA: hypothetical protein VGN17_28830 [Bryobacteraceae bacterium]